MFSGGNSFETNQPKASERSNKKTKLLIVIVIVLVLAVIIALVVTLTIGSFDNAIPAGNDTSASQDDFIPVDTNEGLPDGYDVENMLTGGNVEEPVNEKEQETSQPEGLLPNDNMEAAGVTSNN